MLQEAGDQNKQPYLKKKKKAPRFSLWRAEQAPSK